MQRIGALMPSAFKKPNLTRDEWDEIARLNAAEAEAVKMEKWERIMASVPRAFRDADVRIVDDAIRLWAMRPTVGLMLQGGVGRGKTYSACAALLDISKRSWDEKLKYFKQSVRFTTFDNLLRECRATYEKDESEEDVISKYCNAGVLCLDDLGKEKPSEWTMSVLFHVIDTRHANNRPTIITTQFKERDLSAQFSIVPDTGEAVMSRLRDYKHFYLRGGDRRGYA